MSEKKKDNYISLQQAAKTCEYSQEYLSLRARKGKLKAVKIGRNWMTKKEWLNVYIYNIEKYKKGETHKQIAENYISLQESAKHCPYSQEYLSLRARQGKLKAIKVGRNWTTKKSWLEEYMVGAEEYKSSICKTEIEKVKKVEKKQSFAPENLPVGDFEFVLSPHFLKKPTFKYGLASALVLVLIITGGIGFQLR